MGLRERVSSLFAGGDDPLLGRIKMPCHGVYVHWEFPAPLDVLEFDITIHTDPGTDVGEYFAPYSGSIDGSQFYFGLQTDIQHPETMQGVGKGLIFSTWWSFDAADIRIADDGFHQLGTHEGRFVGVRRGFDWTVGDYRVAITRAEVDVVNGRELDWFDLSIVPIAAKVAGSEARPEAIGGLTWIGAMRFPRRMSGVPARIEPRAALFMEVYSGAETWGEVTPWHVDVMGYGNGVRCPTGRTEYPRYPHGQLMPNANAFIDVPRDRVHVLFGGDTAQGDAPRGWS